MKTDSIKKLLNKKRVKIAFLVILIGIGVVFWYAWRFQVLGQSAIYFFNDVPAPKQGDTILVFSPHPDDETLSAGGYIYSATHSGATVWVVLVTNGNKHRLEERRYQEFSQALAILGVPGDHLYKLNYPDGALAKQDRQVLISQFQQVVDEVHPTIVFAPHLSDTHLDHRITGETVNALSLEPKVQYYEYLIHYPHFPLPRKFAPNLFLLPPIRLVSFDHSWVRFKLTDEVQDRKHEALLQYKSQLRVPILRSLMLGLVRQNELFAIPAKK
jgi:N-acetylglucosamine malate deacetylase 1